MYLEVTTRIFRRKIDPVSPAHYFGGSFCFGVHGLFDRPATRLILALTGLKAIITGPCRLCRDRFEYELDILASTALPRMSGRCQSNPSVPDG